MESEMAKSDHLRVVKHEVLIGPQPRDSNTQGAGGGGSDMEDTWRSKVDERLNKTEGT